MNCSTPGSPAFHHLLELAQTHIHWVDDSIQPSHPLLHPSPPAFNLSQSQGLFQWVSSSDQMTKVWALQLQHQSFQWILRVSSFRIDWFDLLACPRDCQKSSLAPKFKSINTPALSFLYSPTGRSIHMWLLEKPQLWLYAPLTICT